MDRTLSRFSFFKFLLGEGKRPPKLHPGGGFFKRWSFKIVKTSQRGVKLYVEFTRSWSLSCSNTAIFWQITWNHRFWPITSLYCIIRVWNPPPVEIGKIECSVHLYSSPWPIYGFFYKVKVLDGQLNIGNLTLAMKLPPINHAWGPLPHVT